MKQSELNAMTSEKLPFDLDHRGSKTTEAEAYARIKSKIVLYLLFLHVLVLRLGEYSL